ncbi:hypothetical protein SB766_26380, partial [Pseudomonas sp. SIMBA_077]
MDNSFSAVAHKTFSTGVKVFAPAARAWCRCGRLSYLCHPHVIPQGYLRPVVHLLQRKRGFSMRMIFAALAATTILAGAAQATTVYPL